MNSMPAQSPPLVLWSILGGLYQEKMPLVIASEDQLKKIAKPISAEKFVFLRDSP